VSKVFASGQPCYDLVVGVKRPDRNSTTWTIVNAIPIFSEDKKIRKVAVNFIDFTERKKAENVVSKFFEQPMNLHLIASLEGVIHRVNVGWETILGYSKKELEGRSFIDLVHPDDVTATVEEMVKLEKGITTFYFENRYMHKNGAYRLLAWSALVSFEDQMIHAVASDITDRKTLEEQLQQAMKMESIGTLAGGIAHDFNNILTGLFGNIEQAKLQLPAEHAAYSYIQNADQALEKATSLTKQLLTFAKGGDPLLEMTNVGQIIRDSINFSLSGSNIKTTINLPNDLWHVRADKGQLSQVITNLVINANQAMSFGGMLTIEVENITNLNNSFAPHLSGEVVKLSISDVGCGISVEDQKQIFDPYFTTKYTGSGLGLTTVHSIINKHGGHIDVKSEPDVGSTFTIYLPADSSLPQTIETTSSDVTDKTGTKTGNILVMDDDEMILNLLKDMLETFGYSVDCAIDGTEVIEKYISAKKSGDPFDVVIMDLTIPGSMGGKEAMKELLTIDPKVKAVVSSGYSTDSIMANYKEYGFSGRLIKPFQMKELQKELSHLISHE
ncbi:MAG: PAS domain S-box protein, partial [Gammaproteobacteria bacterium]|nr:PAS domain S-box protein [Gammaproteobacteria bacterium]